MKKELLGKTVLAMYDVRGIQNFIFSTNEVKDIIGASELVENIIINGMRSIIDSHTEWKKEEYLLDWENDTEKNFMNVESIKMQVLFIGGGNAYVLYREGKICQEINKALAKYVLVHTYSLNLAVAVVEKTEDYMNDYNEINKEMRKIKSFMAPVKPIGAMPFMQTDSITGYPLSKVYYKGETKTFVSTETANKRKGFTGKEEEEKIFDNLVTKKGDNSYLALVHIDGNSMGSRIKEIMHEQHDYQAAVNTMRKISLNIKNGFLKAFNNMCEYMDAVSDQIIEERWNKLYRKIITAGDDITFVCNPKLAFQAVEAFIQEVSKQDMFWDSDKDAKENHLKYGFSACAGIAFFNSHFPFSDAYQVTEVCCSSAKAEAKKKEHRNGAAENGMIGCYVDYQFCTNVRAAQLKEYREKHYSYAQSDGNMLTRPYYISAASYRDITDLDTRNKEKNIEVFWDNLEAFTSYAKGTNMTRAHAKEMRNAFSFGMEEVDKQIVFLQSRDVTLPKTPEKSWYDALEFMDYYKKGIRYHENQN